jgi:hypothetical protein
MPYDRQTSKLIIGAEVNKMDTSDASEVMERLFGDSALFGCRLFVFCMTRSEMVLITDGERGREEGPTSGQTVFAPMVCGRCERYFGSLGGCARKGEIDEKILRDLAVFKQVEKWCGGEVEVLGQVHRAEEIARAGADYGAGMQTVVSVMGRLEVVDHLKAGFT